MLGSREDQLNEVLQDYIEHLFLDGHVMKQSMTTTPDKRDKF